ncbi:phosphatase PAP2 family protein [Sinomonas mesophila]|uniref:phosphatase PAP2 family protein n=1 Tax=Sinomonas mesophila TaxID=1531955 RepID=UPI0009864A7C|nr:phosphatase PAP2 family protein [Sinomonas mesophila]
MVSEVFQPPFTVGAMLLLSPAASPGWPGTWWYGALAVLFVCVLPFGILLALVRAGRVVDHHVSERAQRAPVLVMSLACITAGIVLLAALGAPASVLAMTVALVAGVAVMAVVSLRWKISGHSASIAAAAVVLPLLLGPGWWAALAVVPLVGWARVTLGAHTLGEVLAGIATGPLIIVGLWMLLLRAA